MAREKILPEARTTRGRVAIIDDHPLVRHGLVAMINNEPDLEVCAEAATREAALDAINSAQPDMVTIDLSLRESDGLELIKDIHLRFPALPMLVLSMHDEAIYAERCLRAGARGYVTKQQMDETVLDAIRCVLGGGQYLSPTMSACFARQYLSEPPRENGSALARLSDRELEVFRWIGGGKSTRAIATCLKLSIKTIETYREHLKSKLSLHSGAELIQAATRWVETGKID